MLNKPTILSSLIIIGLFISFSIDASANDSLTKEGGTQVAQVFQKSKKRTPRFPGKQAGTLKINKEGLDPRIAELESQLAVSTDAQQNLNDKIVELEKQLKILNDRNIELEGQLAEANDARQSFVEGISQLEGRLAEATAAQQPLNARIAELETQLTAATAAQQPLNARIAELETQLASLNIPASPNNTANTPEAEQNRSSESNTSNVAQTDLDTRRRVIYELFPRYRSSTTPWPAYGRGPQMMCGSQTCASIETTAIEVCEEYRRDVRAEQRVFSRGCFHYSRDYMEDCAFRVGSSNAEEILSDENFWSLCSRGLSDGFNSDFIHIIEY